MALHNRRVDLRLLGGDRTQMWAQAFARAAEARSGSRALFVDVPYARLSADPVAVIDQVLQDLGTSLAPEARQQATIRASQPTRGRHQYSLDRYGLTPRAVSDAFPHGA